MSEYIAPSELKTILHSKRANLYYLEHCRVLVNGGRVEYLTQKGKDAQYWNIPIANTTCLLLGTGTSITQAAMRELAKAGILIGFCGGGGTPLFYGNNTAVDIEWLTPQSEYRATEYLQQWVSFWFDDSLRLVAAKHLQTVRLNFIETQWQKTPALTSLPKTEFRALLEQFHHKVDQAMDVQNLLLIEAELTKKLYHLVTQATQYGDFSRAKNGTGTDTANRFLDHGNYLAYGLAATAIWVLGLPHALAVMHGKTRRGALVFDVADLIKDALVLPQAFISAIDGDTEQEFRQHCLRQFNHAGALDIMIDTLKKVAQSTSQRSS